MIGEVIVGLVVTSTVILFLLAWRAPFGREIPRVGFVRDPDPRLPPREDTLELTPWDIIPGDDGEPVAGKLLHGNGGRG